MRSKLLLSVVFLLAVVTDQAAKFAVDSTFNLHDSQRIIGNFLRFTYIRNSGAAFGIKFGNPNVMLAIVILVTVILFYMLLSGKIDLHNIIGKCALVMILGGAIGNLIDRIRMREVIDFIDMGIGNLRWPVYNLADIYVTLGTIILISTYVFISKSSEIT